MKTPLENVSVLMQEENVFIISETPLENCHHPVYYIPLPIFQAVRDFVAIVEKGLDSLLAQKDEKGNIKYWEENYHDKIADLLTLLLKDATRIHISNSLSALGY